MTDASLTRQMAEDPALARRMVRALADRLAKVPWHAGAHLTLVERKVALFALHYFEGFGPKGGGG